MNRVNQLKYALEIFAQERGWGQYHTPKNLVMALSVECAEMAEIFQWKTPDESKSPDINTLMHIKQEIGDIMIYLTMLADFFEFDPVDAAFSKMQLNEKKYPAEYL